MAIAGVFTKQPKFLPADQAFQFSEQQQDNQLQLHWQIANGYWLYQKEIQIDAPNVQMDPITYPPAKQHQDPFFGPTKIYQKSLNINLNIKDFSPNAKVSVTYQGCTEGLCYPPETKEIHLSELLYKKTKDSLTNVVNTDITQNNHISEQESLAAKLFNSKFAVFWFFILGLGLAFTPCVLPMLPLLSAVVIGNQQRPSNWRALALSFTYVQGMALIYTLLGLTVAAIGLPFQVALQSPPVLITLSVIFVLLSLSMFGLFTLQLPTSLQTKLTLFSQKQKAGAFGGVFVMGMLAGLVASPCTSAPLSGALLYVAQSGNLFMGAITLYLLALGMGVPLILITVFGNKILPKSGMWMESVKVAFGFVMLALPVFLISRLVDEIWQNSLWALLGSSFFIWLALQFKNQSWGILFKIIALIAAMVCVQPLQNILWQNNQTASNITQTNISSHIQFQKVKNINELKQALKNNPHKIAMVDFYADWCIACKEFETQTFTNPKVQEAFKHILLLQVDMTKNSPENKVFTEKLKIMGLPTIVFFNQQGSEIQGSRVTGFMPANKFLHWLENITY